MVGLPGYGARMPAQLSGGQQQRVALARVLATDPRVLLFDEPLSALDRNLRDTLKYAILELQRRTGKTAIYVTHDQSEAFAISDRIVVMNGGPGRADRDPDGHLPRAADAVRGRVHRRQQRAPRGRRERRAGPRAARDAGGDASRRSAATSSTSRCAPTTSSCAAADAATSRSATGRRLPPTRGHPGPRRGRAADRRERRGGGRRAGDLRGADGPAPRAGRRPAAARGRRRRPAAVDREQRRTAPPRVRRPRRSSRRRRVGRCRRWSTGEAEPEPAQEAAS